MECTVAERRIGKWSAHNTEFSIARSSIGRDVRCHLILKLLKRTQQLGIGLYVYQEKSAMRTKLQRELADWHPDGLRVSFCGLADREGDEGFALYAFIDGIAPRNLEDGAVQLEPNLDVVCGHIRTVVEKLKGVANFDFH